MSAELSGKLHGDCDPLLETGFQLLGPFRKAVSDLIFLLDLLESLKLFLLLIRFDEYHAPLRPLILDLC